MPDINILLQQIKQARTDLMNALPELALLNTISAKALAERNIRDRGFGAAYSNHKIPAFNFLGHEKSKAGERFIRQRMKEDDKNATIVNGEKVYAEGAGMTWAELRQAEGLQTDHVDLGFTNKMWAGMVPQEPYYSEGKIICPLGGNNVEVINKWTWQNLRYGNFFGKALGEREIEILTEALVERVQLILRKNGFRP